MKKRIALVAGCALLYFAFILGLNAITSPRAGHIVPEHAQRPGVIMIGDPGLLDIAGTKWETEVARRFPYAVVVLCHGQDLSGVFYSFPSGEITSGTPVDDLMTNLTAEYPGRTVVILSCNPEHIALHGHPNCYYSTSSTWVVPDRNVDDPEVQGFSRLLLDPVTIDFPSGDDGPKQPRWVTDPDVTGNVFEMIEAR